MAPKMVAYVSVTGIDPGNLGAFVYIGFSL
jgi:hypothetical protein